MGHRTQLAIYPDLGLGFWTSETGGRWSDLTGLAQLFLEIYAVELALGQEPWLNASYACSFAPPVPPPAPAPPATGAASPPQHHREPCAEDLAQVEGAFHHSGYGRLEIFCSAGQQLWAKYGDLQMLLSLSEMPTEGGGLSNRTSLPLHDMRHVRAFDVEFQRPLLLYFGWRGGVTGCDFPNPCQGGMIFAMGAELGLAISVEVPFLEANTAAPRFDRIDEPPVHT